MAPIDIEFFSLEPMRIPMSSPSITMSGPMSIFLSPMFIPGIGDGDEAGICIPGISICFGVGDGADAGICIPGMSICFGVGDGADAGICIPGMPICFGVGDGDADGMACLCWAKAADELASNKIKLRK
jgi:hypothetical protein